MSKKKMAREISEYLREKLSSSETKKRVTFRRASQLHEPTKVQKSRKQRKQAKKDIQNGEW